jgi:hypothetical protein
MRGRRPTYANHIERKQAEKDIRHAKAMKHEVEFIAVDGEGMGRWRDHKYVLLSVGDESISNVNGLEIDEILAFIYEIYLQHPRATFVGFFLGYDFTQWFKTLPKGRAEYLLTPAGIAKRGRKNHTYLGPFPVEYGEWQFDILGMKRFKFRKKGDKSWCYICDAGSFFQTSFMKVIDPANWEIPVCTKDEYETLQEGKKLRDVAILGPDMVRYNILENRVLATIMGRLNTGFVEAGIRLKRDQWFGPGQAAQEWLGQQTGMPDLDILSGTQDLAQYLAIAGNTYYGGWFEIFAHGHIPGMSYEYDINSAYPYIASRLPCLLHGKWLQGMGTPGSLPENGIRIIHATVRGSDKHLGSMLHRVPKGLIKRPNATGGYYWQSEIDAAIRCNIIDTVDYIEWWEYHPCNCLPPMRLLAELYRKRREVGKSTPFGKAIKLLINSVYGKLAQSIGHPRFGNAIYASLITSGCRSMILDAITTHPSGTSSLLMVATDGVYFREPHNSLSLSSDLGDWEETSHENLTLFKPGVYWDDKAREQIREDKTPSFKARGINATAFAKSISAVDDKFTSWNGHYPTERDPNADREGWYPSITFHSGFSMVTCQQALQRGKWFLAGAVSDASLKQDADPVSKRRDGEFRDGVYWSYPYKDGGPPSDYELETYGVTHSTPYDKTFGQPDQDEYGITDDGPVLFNWTQFLMGRG